MKKYFIYSAALLALVSSCQSDDFLGNTPGNVETNSAYSAIKFDGNAGKISRATSNSGTPQQMLDYQFKIYGVKKGTDNKYSKVFGDYRIWYATNKTTSNTNNWEYVGSGTITTGDNNSPTTIPLNNAQTIKYWDYASDNYHFVAGSPIDNFTYTTNSDGDITSATVSGLGGHINPNPTGTKKTFNPVYVAAPKVIAKVNYKAAVKFDFVRQQSMVRVGIYETIPGYKIEEIHFYKYDNDSQKLKASNDQNIILTSEATDYFVGGENVTGKITYDWSSSTTPNYKLEYTESNSLVKSQNWYGGTLDGVKAIASTETTIANLYGTDQDMATNGYFTVMPTAIETIAKAILIKCDYTLESEDGSGETIKVTGATAAIPAAYSKWDVNTRYTYLFKISDNTNGTTGNPDNNDSAGLYPITFNAVVTDMTDNEGTITTFTTPSITTKQDGSVDENSGIKYVVNKAITVKVANSEKGIDLDLTSTKNTNGYIDVYKFTTPITEAEVQVNGLTSGTEVTNGRVNTSEKSFTFTPDAEGYYVIRYLTQTTSGSITFVNTYKVVHVVAN